MSKEGRRKNPAKLKARIVELLEGGPLIPGSIKKQWNVCGIAGCRCKDPENPQKHGPYNQLSFTLAGKSTTMFVKDDELERMSAAVERYHAFKSLSLALVQAYVEVERKDRKKRSKKRQGRNG
jgi:hypothetical protein